MNQTNARFGNAFTLETERLYLVALTVPQLGLWLENLFPVDKSVDKTVETVEIFAKGASFANVLDI